VRTLLQGTFPIPCLARAPRAGEKGAPIVGNKIGEAMQKQQQYLRQFSAEFTHECAYRWEQNRRGYAKTAAI
jgi:hypothetical protein